MSSFQVWLSCTTNRAKNKKYCKGKADAEIMSPTCNIVTNLPEYMTDCLFPWQQSHLPVREWLPTVRMIRRLSECDHWRPAHRGRNPQNLHSSHS